MWIELLTLTVFWSTLYFVVKFVFKAQSLEYCNRIVALTHSIVICRLIEYSAYISGNPFLRIGGENTDSEQHIMLFSSSYFIFDTVWCLFMKSEGLLMLFHHFIGAVMLPIAYINGVSGAEILVALWAGELTNPFLQYRFFLKINNMAKGTLAFWNDFSFAVTFISIRVGFLSVLCYYFVKATHIPIMIKVFGIAFYIVGLVWSYKVIGFVKRKLM
jgi:TLC domain.